MKTETLIRRAAAKMERKMAKEGKSAAQIKKAIEINFPSLTK